MNDIRAILLAAETSTRMKQQKMLLSYKGSIIIETKYKKDIENPDPEKGLKSLYQKFTNHILELECSLP